MIKLEPTWILAFKTKPLYCSWEVSQYPLNAKCDMYHRSDIASGSTGIQKSIHRLVVLLAQPFIFSASRGLPVPKSPVYLFTNSRSLDADCEYQSL
jgi:hypothetical protein